MQLTAPSRVARTEAEFSRSARGARGASVVVVAVLLGVLTATTLISAWYAIIVPQQLDEGEPLVYGLAGRLLQHQPLYQPIDRQPFVQVHYTPLYYLAVAALHSSIGPGFAPGRALSLLAGLGAAVLVGYLAAACARDRWAGAFAALMFVALGFPGGPVPFLALARVDVLGVCLSVAAIAVLSSRTSWLAVVIGGLFAGLALLTKQSLFAAALAGTLWLITVDRRKALVFAAATAMTVLIPGLVLQVSSGGSFWTNIGPANPSPLALPLAAYLFKELLAIQGIPIVLATSFVLATRAWQWCLPRLVAIYWLATSLSIVGMLKVGANHNYWIEFAAATAVLATLCIWRPVQPGPRLARAAASMVPLWVLAAQLGVLVPARFMADRSDDLLPGGWTLALDQLTSLAAERGEFSRLVHDASGEKDPVLAESMDIAVLGDHPVAFEPFAFSMLEYEGRWNPQPLIRDICSGRITLLILSYPIELDVYPGGLEQFPMWPRSVMTALRESMALEGPRAFHWLYRPQPAPDAAKIAECTADALAQMRNFTAR